MKKLLMVGVVLGILGCAKQTESIKGVYYPNVEEMSEDCYTDECLGSRIMPQSAYDGHVPGMGE